MGAAVATAWECQECGVRATFAPRFEPPARPAGWVEGEGGWTCLACVRKLARQAARAGDPEALEALVDAELRRGRGVNSVVGATGASATLVRVRRRRLIEAGQVKDPAARPSPPKRAAAGRKASLAALRKMGEAGVEELRGALGMSRRTASRRLDDLEKRGLAESRRLPGRGRRIVWRATDG